MAPDWLPVLASRLPAPGNQLSVLVGFGYLLIAAGFLVLTLILRPNANSLHPLYRDRLGKAFLFEPQRTLKSNEELKQSRMRLAELSGRYGPYHLINTALNVQNSKTANKRGSQCRLLPAEPEFRRQRKHRLRRDQGDRGDRGRVGPRDRDGRFRRGRVLEHGSAKHQGADADPGDLEHQIGLLAAQPIVGGQGGTRNIWANFYFLLELFGRLNERRKSVYLTDGGQHRKSRHL